MTPTGPIADPGREVQDAIAAHGAPSLEARQAFQSLHSRYFPFSYALASRKAHPDDVEDIVQETWIAVWKRLQDEPPVERFSSLLEAICRNKVADANERRFRRKRLAHAAEHTGPWVLSLDEPVDTTSPEGERWADTLESTDVLPETAILERERTEELWRLIERLPDNWRMAILYRFYNQMSVIETARTMDTTEDAIKKYVFRAVRRLKEWMQDDTEFWLT